MPNEKPTSTGLKSLAKDTVIYGVADFAPRTINLLLLPIMTRFLNAKDYGILSLIAVVSAFSEIIFHFGAENAFSRFYPEHSDQASGERTLRTISFQLFAQGIIGSVVLVLLFPAVLQIIMGEKTLHFWPYGAVGIFVPFLYLTSSIPLLQARIDGKPIFYLFFRLGTFFVSLITTLYFVVFLKQGVLGSIKGQFAGAVVSALVLLWAYRSILFKWDIDSSLLKRSFRFGFPLFTSSISSWFFSFSDRIFIQRFRSTETVGMFQIASNFVLPVDFFINSVNFSFSPRFYKEFVGQKNYEAITRDGLRIIGIIFFALISYLAFLRPIISVMTHSTFHIAYRIADLLIFYYATRILWCLLSDGLSVSDRPGTIAKITISSGVIQLIFNFILIAPYGAIGAAIATIITGVVRSIMALFIVSKLWPIPLPKKQFLCLILFFIFFGTVIVFTDFQFTSPWNAMAWGVKIPAVIVFYFLTRKLNLMFSISEFFRLLKLV